MKKLLILGIGLLCTFVNAQNIDDVIRYCNDNLQGTARFQAMGGAFGALGGDLSSLNINPAGSAVFSFSEFTVTGSNYNRNNDAIYGNSISNIRINALEINQAGVVFVFKSSDEDSAWKKISLAINYDLVNNFDNEFRASGNSTQGIDNYFLNFAEGQALRPLGVQNGERIDDAYLDIGSSIGFGAQQAFLGFQSGLIDPDEDTDENIGYFSNAQYTNVNQDYAQITSGYNGGLH